MLCVEFPEVQYIDFSELIHFWKHSSWALKLNHFLIAKVSPEWRLNPRFGTLKMRPFPLNRGVPSIEVTDTKIMWTFLRDQILCPLNGDVPSKEVS